MLTPVSLFRRLSILGCVLGCAGAHVFAATTWDVSISGFAFVPSTLTVQVGDTVRWTQNDSTTHTTTSGPNGVADGIWNSGNMTLVNNRVFSFTFSQAGVFPYFCIPHRSFMRGTITVEAPEVLPQVNLVNPADNAAFFAPASIDLQAQVVAGSHPVQSVTFLEGANVLGSASAVPYSLTWGGVAAGSYGLTAVVEDTAGNKATSGPVHITVSVPEPLVLSSAQPVGQLGMRLQWLGGVPPFVIQKIASLGSTEWADVATTPDRAIILARDTGAGFYRIGDHDAAVVTPMTVWANGALERPDPVDTQASAFGTLSLKGTTLTVRVQFANLSGPAKAAHIHGPSVTTNVAGVLVPLTVPPAASGTIEGTYDLSGLTGDQLEALRKGRTYLNIHTAAHSGGEIRGQVAPVLWEAALSGAAERPTPVDTTATGYGDFWLIGNEFTYDVDYDGLSSVATRAHLHGPADAEGTAGVLQELQPENNLLGTTGAFSGTLTLSNSQLSQVADGLTYVNVHTGTHAAGEVRGQVLP